MASGQSGNFSFSNPTIWKNSYTYFKWTSSINNDRSRTLVVSQYMYVQVNYGIQGTWTFRCNVNGIEQTSAPHTFNIPAGGNNVANTIKIAEYNFTLTGASFQNLRTPPASITTYANIGFYAGNGPGASNATANINLDSIPLPSFIMNTFHTPTPDINDATSKIQPTANIGSDQYNFYMTRVYISKSADMTNAVAADSGFGATVFSPVFSGLDPYTNYYLRAHLIGVDGATYTSDHVRGPIQTFDIYPQVSGLNLVSVTQNEASISYTVTSRSPVTALYYLNSVQNGTASSIGASVTKTFTGLTAGTTTYVYVVVSNGSGSRQSPTLEIGTAAAPPSISAVTTTPTSATIAVAVTATAPSGIRGYTFSKDNGTTWTAEQVSSAYTFTGLTPGRLYQIKVRVYDTLGIMTTSNTYSVLTQHNPPVIASVAISDITVSSAVVRVIASSGIGIKGYRFSLDGGVSYSTLQTSSTYLLSNLAPQQTYNIRVRAVDIQDVVVTAGPYTFTTLSVAPLESVAKVKLTRNVSAALNDIPLVDGNIVFTVDDGRMYLDHKINDTTTVRSIIGNSQKIYNTIVVPGTPDVLNVVTTDFENLFNGMSMFIRPHDGLRTAAAARLKLNALAAVDLYDNTGAPMSGNEFIFNNLYHVIYDAQLIRFVVQA